MNKTERYIVYAVLALAVGFILWEQFDKAVLNAQAQAEAKAQQAYDKKLSDALAARDKQYQADRAVDQATVADARKSVATMAAFANSKVPQAPAPIVVHTGALETVTLHTGDAVIPAESSTAFFDAFAAGNTCTSLDLPKCRGDLVDWQARYEAKQKESDDWKKAAKGGSWLHRLKNDAIRVGIGVGIGYALKR